VLLWKLEAADVFGVGKILMNLQKYSPSRTAWGCPEAESEDGKSSGRITSRQLCGPAAGTSEDQVTPIAMDGSYGMLELEPTAAPKASCWGYMCGHSTRQRDGGTSYEAPPQSPGSRHAFASRFSGPRSLGTGTSKLMSPGCLSDDYETTAIVAALWMQKFGPLPR
jgi:hypothetical protein